MYDSVLDTQLHSTKNQVSVGSRPASEKEKIHNNHDKVRWVINVYVVLTSIARKVAMDVESTNLLMNSLHV